MTRKTLAALVLAATSFALAGCAAPQAAPAADGKVQVVASTNVYGDLASAVGGDLVDVASIVTSGSQDPHSYESTARDQLTISRAQLVIENGGGYDSFVDALLESSKSDAVVLTAVEYSHDWPENGGHDDHADDEHATEDAHDESPATEDAHAGEDGHAGHDHVEGFNEHVWYDPHTMVHLVEDIAHELSALDAANAKVYEDNAAALIGELEGLEQGLADLATTDEGDRIFVTEPVPLYLTGAAGLDNVTPAAFSEAVEEGQDVPPATLLEALGILRDDDVRAVIVNAQTGGAETTEVVQVAKDQGIPVLEFTELIPEGETYVTWMRQNIADLAGTLTR